MDSLETMVQLMKIKDSKSNQNYFELMKNMKHLIDKCIYARAFLCPQSTIMESIVRHDLLIEKPKNKTSGDGYKNGTNFEIKCSVHAKGSKLNFVQIRPDHQIDYYILIGYNMYANIIGKAFILKVPINTMHKLVIRFGSYAHGTCKELGKINEANLKGRHCEYALRCNLNSKKGKNYGQN